MSVILSPSQMQNAERLARSAGIEAFTLMKAAGKAVAEGIMARYAPAPVLVLCGPGNNGGDGFVAASFLKKKKWPVSLACAVSVPELPDTAAQAAALWKGEILSFDDLDLWGQETAEETIIIDAVFGTGLSRPIGGKMAEVLEWVQQSPGPVVAVDVPSGLDAETGECQDCTPQADVTITFFRKKKGHVLMPGADACGEVVVADIGISDDVLPRLGQMVFENGPDLAWAAGIADKPRNSHKYDYGHVLVLGGRAMTGAAALAALAALRAGAGLVTIASPAEVAPVYKGICPSVMVEEMGELARFKEHIKDPRRNVVLLGPGAGLLNPPALKKAVFDVLVAEPGRVCVLDADALMVFEDDVRTFYKALHARAVLTPHEGEFRRIFPDLAGSKPERAVAAALRTRSFIVLKGPDTVIASPEGRVVVNTSGTGWLATAGAGDVLAGLVAGFAARWPERLFDAVCAAVWVHGQCAENVGPGLISADLPDQIPLVLKNLASP